MAKIKVDLEPKDFLKSKLTHDLKNNTGRRLLMGSTITIQEIVGDIEPGMRRFGKNRTSRPVFVDMGCK